MAALISLRGLLEWVEKLLLLCAIAGAAMSLSSSSFLSTCLHLLITAPLSWLLAAGLLPLLLLALPLLLLALPLLFLVVAPASCIILPLAFCIYKLIRLWRRRRRHVTANQQAATAGDDVELHYIGRDDDQLRMLQSEIDTIQKIVGYPTTPAAPADDRAVSLQGASTCNIGEQIRELYVFLGIEPSASLLEISNDSHTQDDLGMAMAELQLLKVVVGVRFGVEQW